VREAKEMAGGFTKPLSEKDVSGIQWSWSTIVAFMVLGVNPSWSLPCALFVEVPIFQQDAPEGLSLAAWMNVAINIGLVLTFVFVFYDTFIYHVKTEHAINFVIVFSSICCLVCAFTWTYTAWGMSITILGMCMLGGTVGTFQVLVFLPYLTRFHPYCFALARLGDVIFVGVLSILGLMQQATSITPTVFFLVLAPTQLIPLLSMVHISRNKLGISPEKLEQANAIETQSEIAGKVDRESGELVPLARNEKPSKSPPKGSSGICNADTFWNELGQAWPLITIVCLINMHMWGSFISLIPIASFNAAPQDIDKDGVSTLAYAQNFGLLALVPGIMLAPSIKCSEATFYWLSTFQVLLYAIVYAAVFNVLGEYFCWGTTGAAVLLVFVFCFSRFIESFVATSVYTHLGDKYPKSSYKIASFMGVCDRLATSVMTWASFYYVIVLRSDGITT